MLKAYLKIMEFKAVAAVQKKKLKMTRKMTNLLIHSIKQKQRGLKKI
jgi:hypothetical protein